MDCIILLLLYNYIHIERKTKIYIYYEIALRLLKQIKLNLIERQ